MTSCVNSKILAKFFNTLILSVIAIFVLSRNNFIYNNVFIPFGEYVELYEKSQRAYPNPFA